MRAFLRFVVEATLNGEEDRLKGYTIATGALGRDSSFNPSNDPIVRVEAARLRRRIQAYYAGSGIEQPIRFVIPTGTYAPRIYREPFQKEDDNSQAQEEAPPPSGSHVRSLKRQRLALWGLCAFLALALGSLLYLQFADSGPPLRQHIQKIPVDEKETGPFAPPKLYVENFTTESFTADQLDLANYLVELLKDSSKYLSVVQIMDEPDEQTSIISGSVLLVGGQEILNLRLDTAGSTIPFLRRRIESGHSLQDDPQGTRDALARSIVEILSSLDVSRPVIGRWTKLSPASANEVRWCVVETQFLISSRFATDQDLNNAETCLSDLQENLPNYIPAKISRANLELFKSIISEGPQSQQAFDRAMVLIADVPVDARSLAVFQTFQMLQALARDDKVAVQLMGKQALLPQSFNAPIVADYAQELLVNGQASQASQILEGITPAYLTYPERFDVLLSLAYYSENEFEKAQEVAFRARPRSYPLAWFAQILSAKKANTAGRVAELISDLRKKSPDLYDHPECVLIQQLGYSTLTDKLLADLKNADVGSIGSLADFDSAKHQENCANVF
ncbi:hypothetical protein E1162_15265 [Rhodobacteraceae bacterium RKSG542]|uniref:hypothetical protein n=1 Tax=Pseudovibrio flavus TaxID=2529854 RepID=UPI0012BC194D|nr:hypothetical protein [Pseudovibrio flavus]MTI18603.1 hypothetical protein [Pseudovibrio flavus]